MSVAHHTIFPPVTPIPIPSTSIVAPRPLPSLAIPTSPSPAKPPPTSPPPPLSTLSPTVLLPLLLLLPLRVLPQHALLLLDLLCRLLHSHGRLLQVRRVARVRLLALRPLRAEAREVELAQRLPDVLLGAAGPQRAEAALVPRARREAGVRVDVEVETLVCGWDGMLAFAQGKGRAGGGHRTRRRTSIAAVPVPHEEVALGHLPQVVLVQELAALALLAQAAQPVLAHEVVEVAVVALRDMAVRARVAHGAVALEEGLACRPCVRDAESLRREEERAEGELVTRVLVLDDLLGQLVRARVGRERLCFHREGLQGERVVLSPLMCSRYVWSV